MTEYPLQCPRILQRRTKDATHAIGVNYFTNTLIKQSPHMIMPKSRPCRRLPQWGGSTCDLPNFAPLEGGSKHKKQCIPTPVEGA